MMGYLEVQLPCPGAAAAASVAQQLQQQQQDVELLSISSFRGKTSRCCASLRMSII
jgi:hypothetical protein